MEESSKCAAGFFLILSGVTRYGPQGLKDSADYHSTHCLPRSSFQLERGGQWVKGKSAESFNPCGPYLVTPDEVEKLGTLELSLDVNGVRRQTGKTNDMLFGVAEIIHYLSQFMTLEPGDLINTGTPPGVALGMNPPLYLQPGDVVECAITGLGRQRSIVSLTTA